MLLNFYKYSEKTRLEFVAALRKLGGRLWVPSQAAAEFHRNRIGVVHSQVKLYDGLMTQLDGMAKAIEERVNATRHPLLNDARDAAEFRRATDSTIADLRMRRDQHFGFFEKDPMMVDPILQGLEAIIGKNVGKLTPPDTLQNWYAEGKKRYAARVPPGYRDSQKPEPERYGDLVLWFELIEHAKQAKAPIVFVTDDAKEDWWLDLGSKTLGPRPELVNEMLREAAVPFYAYDSERFLQQANTFVGANVSKEAIKEAREVTLTSGPVAMWTAPAGLPPEKLRTDLETFLRGMFGESAVSLSQIIDFELSPGDSFEVWRRSSLGTTLEGRARGRNFTISMRSVKPVVTDRDAELTTSFSVCPVCRHLNPSGPGVFVGRCEKCGKNYAE